MSTRTISRLSSCLLLFAAGSCGDGAGPPTSPGSLDPGDLLVAAHAIVDGAHGGHVPGFFWEPPTVASKKGPPVQYSGTFDAGLLALTAPDELKVEICQIDGDDPADPSACSGPILRTLDGGVPPEEIRVDVDAENYSVTWQSTNDGDIQAGETYRAFVSAAGVVLGYIDLVAAARSKDLKRLDTDEFGGLVVGSPFVFKFRVETGIPGAVTVTPADPTIEDDETQLFTATVADLYGALLPGADVDWTIDDASIATLAPTSGTTDGAGETATTATPAGALGTTTVRATSQGAEGSTSLTVEPSEVAPTAVDDSYGPVGTFPLTATSGGAPDGLLANDTGIPAPAVTFFGGGSLGGSVTDNAAGGPAVDLGAGGSLSVGADGGFTFTPNTGFTGDFTFQYRISNGVPPDADATVLIQVESAPMVSSTTPADGAANQAVDTDIVVTFSEAVTLGTAWFEMVCGTSGTLGVGDTNVTGGPTVFTIDPNADFAEGESCTVTVDKDEITDQDGTPDHMAADYVFTFTVDEAPSVSTTSPVDGATDVAPTDVITIDFSESVNATTSSFTVECPAPGNAQAFSLSASPNASFTLTPTSDLPAGTTCTVTVVASEISDADAGDPPDLMASDFTFSFTLPVVAVDDTYPETVVGNVSVSSANVGGGAFSVLDNDLASNPITVTAYDAISANGGTVVVNADGTFTYDPPPGYEGLDSFGYTMSDGNTSDDGTVSLTVQDVIWFVDHAAAGGGDGRLSHPFNCLVGAGCFDAVASDEAGDVIFVYESATAYEAGLTLLSNQRLIGQDATSTLSALSGITPPASSAALPAMNTGGNATTLATTVAATDAVTLGTGNHVYGLTIAGTTGVGIVGTGFGTATIDDVSITGAGGALDLTTGTAAFAFDALSSSSGARGIDLDGVGGTLSHGAASALSGHSAEAVRIANSSLSFDYDGSISNGASGIVLTTNPGATLDFGGALSLTTGANKAFTATGGGTVSATAAGSALTTTTGIAVDVANTAIGAAGLTFQSVSANGATSGISLLNTGNGPFMVTGTGTTDGSGGTIRNTTGDGVVLSSVKNVTLKNMVVGNAAATLLQGPGATVNIVGDGISATNVTPTVAGNAGLTLDNVLISETGAHGIDGTGVVGLSISNSEIIDAGDGNDEHGLAFDGVGSNNLSGTVALTNVQVNGSSNHNLFIQNSSGVLTATIQGTTAADCRFANTTGSAFGDDGVQFDIRGTADATITVDKCTFEDLESDGVTGFAQENSGATLDLTVQNSVFTGCAANTCSGTGSDNALSIRTAGNGTLDFDVLNNTIGSNNTAILLQSNDNSVLRGNVSNNTIGTGAADSGSRNGRGIDVFADDNSTATVLTSNNTIRNTDFEGIFGLANDGGGGTPTLNFTVTGNTVATPDDNSAFPLGVASIEAAALNTAVICLDIQGNDADVGSTSFGLTFDAIRLRQRDTSTFNIERLALGPQSEGTTETHVAGENPLSFSVEATFDTNAVGVANGTCATPP